MLRIAIPGFGTLTLKHLVTDFTGTLSVDGRLLPGVKERLDKIANILKIHIVTADTFGSAKSALKGIRCQMIILSGKNHDKQKERLVKKLGPAYVVSLGNGNNDRKMLRVARLGIAITEREGCAVDALTAADIHVENAVDGLDLLLKPKRCKATLRY
jgi:soluble P-type ATPase